MRTLNAAQIGGDARFPRGIDRFAEIMAKQHILSRNGGVRFQRELKMAVGALAREQRVRRGIDMGIEIDITRRGVIAGYYWSDSTIVSHVGIHFGIHLVRMFESKDHWQVLGC